MCIVNVFDLGESLCKEVVICPGPRDSGSMYTFLIKYFENVKI